MESVIKIILFIFAWYTLILSSFFDIKAYRIPNWITLPMVLIGLLLTLFLSPKEALIRLAVILILFIFSFVRLIGNGDIKLLMAITALTGAAHMLFSVLIGAILMLLIWILKDRRYAITNIRQNIVTMLNKQPITYKRENRIPFAPFVTIGYLLVCIGRYCV